eukprot:TRINITY_DN655_c0_g2_i2.p1 TRINITY_DN655_c0_g2~~TRINITY_DN655_c0_g2_i2.p1  ORF type:complete len:256 (-),score=38.41 TRINITY_DN655_c0_g2_i2:22-789(-)
MTTGYTILVVNKRYSSWSMRGWLALRHAAGKGNFQEIRFNLAGPAVTTEGLNLLPRSEITKYSPTGKVPVLIDHELGVSVHESIAVVLHIAEKFPHSGLLPSDPAARAVCLSVCSEMHSGFVGMRTNMPCHFLGKAQKHGTEVLKKSEVLADINRIGTMWTELRTKFGENRGGSTGGGTFLFGAFSVADCMYAPITARFMTYDPTLSSLEAFPKAQEYLRTLYNDEIVQEWIEDAKKEGPETYVEQYEAVLDQNH